MKDSNDTSYPECKDWTKNSSEEINMGKIWSNNSSTKESWLDRYAKWSFQKIRSDTLAETDVAGLIQEMEWGA